MAIVKTEYRIDKWEVTGSFKDSIVNTGEAPSFELTPYRLAFTALLTTDTAVQFNDMSDNIFILDIVAISKIEFNANGIPALDELYEMFVQQRIEIHGLIWEKLDEMDLRIKYKWPDIDEAYIRRELQSSIEQAYSQN